MTNVQLTVIATEAGAHIGACERYQWNMRADLADIRLWRFYHAAPDEFFTNYADHCVIDHVHLARNALTNAVDFLSRHPDRHLTLACPVSAKHRRELAERCRLQGITHQVVAHPAPRAVHYHEGRFCSRLPLAQALKQAGIAEPTHSPSMHWAQWYRRFSIEDVIAELRLRDPGVFFTFLKELAQFTALPLNWQAVADASGVSAPTAKQWGRFLESIGLIDLVPAQTAPAPRRALARPKLYWTSPGLALWLRDAMMHVGEADRLKYVENAVYLALKDAFVEGEFLHFLDTNKVCAPLLMRESPDAPWRMYAVGDSAADELFHLKHHKSLSRIGLVQGALHSIRLDNAPSANEGNTDVVWHRLSVSP